MLIPLLFSCSGKSVPLDAYVNKTLAWHENFRVLQLTDIHWNEDTDIKVQSAYLNNVVRKIKADASIDFIMITGDLLLGASQSTAQSLFDVINGWDIPYGITWGNHDRQGTYSPAWLSQLASSGKKSFYNEQNDNVYGRSNYIVSVMDGSTPKWNILSIDSNSYKNPQNGYCYDYDVIHDDQINWFNEEADAMKKGSDYVPTVAYFHIPLWQWYYAWAEKNSSYDTTIGAIGEMLETSVNNQVPSLGTGIKFWPGYKDSGFFKAGAQHGIKAFYCGHDHSNDYGDMYTDGEGNKAYVGYGVKSGTELYYTHSKKRNCDIIGGAVTTLKGDGSFALTHYYVQTDGETVVKEEAAL